MAKRVFELARELGVTSKKVLEKCRAEGIDIKNHMSTVSAGLQATVREWFSEQDGPGTAVETAEHVDLDKARKEAAKKRRRAKKKEELETEEAGEAETEAQAPEAEADVEPGAAAVAEAPDAGEAVEAAEAEVAAEASEAEVVAEAGEGESVAEAETPAAEAAAKAPAAVEADEAEADEADEEAEKEEEEVEIKPAGPQVVPKPAKLKGPNVVRVEAPDVIDLPRRRPRPRPRPTGAPPVATPSYSGGPPRGGGRGRGKGTAATDKTRRRSPRRRGGGRSADSGEKLKEWREKDLLERKELVASAGGGLRRHRATVRGKRVGGGAGVRSGKVEVEEPITVKTLSAATGLKGTEIIRKLMASGTLVTINQVIDRELAELAVADYGIELDVIRAMTAEEELMEKLDARERGEMAPRAPVVTFLGHVDHGKTSLLDRIRNAAVADGEAGGITQHIGSYRYDVGGRQVVFLDTPGHEAFTAMRARGANMTDVVVLVVAADDGVMPQTLEAISHAKAAEVPIVVALNKIDVPNANVNRAMGQLAENGLQPREWGGDTEVIQTSAATGEGIDTLVETLALEAELLELKAEYQADASGYVIEGELDPGRGAVARLLVLNGTLRVGDIVLAGKGYGRVRQMLDSRGQEITEAPPATPVEIAGLEAVPDAGDRFHVTQDIDQARSVAVDRRQRARAEELASGAAASRVTLENLFSQIEDGKVTEVALILKVDVQGSGAALRGQLEKLSTDEVRVNILHIGVGGISTGDVTLAEASNAIIIGFNVVPDAAARQLAETEGVDIRLYRVIYDITEDIRKVLEEGLAPEIRQETLGHAEVRRTFKISRLGTIAGCYVTDGLVTRNAKVRIIRDNIVLEDERDLDSLKRVKDDAREVRAGLECGLKIKGYDDIKEGDQLEFYQRVEVARTL